MVIDELKRLKQENEFLRLKLKEYGYIFIDENNKLTSDEKIKIFQEYFLGRDDVYAKRYYNKKKNKYAYSFACLNEFKNGCKKKYGGFCDNSCLLREYEKLDENIIKKHFVENGKGIGIYPLLKDNTCNFVAIDFDGDTYFEEMFSVYQIALSYKFQGLMERSSSGIGGHLWFFFSYHIKAAKTRRFANFLISEAMKLNKHLDFSSFDRLFPNQDYLTNKGLGNLIALPLRYDAFILHKNTAFINEKGQVIEKQIEYLSSIPKINELEIDCLIKKDVLDDYFFNNNQIGFEFGLDNKYNLEINCEESSMLKIEKCGLNALTLHMIKRIASMNNPQYYLFKKLRKPIYLETTPRVLSEYVEDDIFIYIPRGLKDQMNNTFMHSKINFSDLRTNGHEIDVSFKGSLYDYQIEPVETLLKYDMGVMHAFTAYGKTVMALNIIARLKRSVLIIVPTKQLLKQWKDRIESFLVFPQYKLKRDYYVGECSGSKKNLKGNMDVAIINSLANLEEKEKYLSRYGLIIIDECHHAASDTFIKVLRNISSKYIYSFSATPKREDGLEKIMYMYCGDIRYVTSKNDLKKKQAFRQILVLRYTSSKLLKKDVQYVDILNELARNDLRNYMISKDIMRLYDKQAKIIVLSERINHLEVLYEKIRDISNNIFILHGQLKESEKKYVLKKINDIGEKEPFILLATSKLVGEGFDLPFVDTLLLTLPVAAESRVSQYVGRIHREYKDKKVVKVYDYVDINISMLENMFRKRLKEYYNQGYQLEEENTIIEMDSIVFNESNYELALFNDIKNANKEIIIINEKIKLSKFKRIYSVLQEKIQNGVSVYIATDQEQNEFEELKAYILGCGCGLTQYRGKHIIIIDQIIVWYCSFDFLSYRVNDMNCIRLKNEKLACEIMEIE